MLWWFVIIIEGLVMSVLFDDVVFLLLLYDEVLVFVVLFVEEW